MQYSFHKLRKKNQLRGIVAVEFAFFLMIMVPTILFFVTLTAYMQAKAQLTGQCETAAEWTSQLSLPLSPQNQMMISQILNAPSNFERFYPRNISFQVSYLNISNQPAIMISATGHLSPIFLGLWLLPPLRVTYVITMAPPPSTQISS